MRKRLQNKTAQEQGVKKDSPQRVRETLLADVIAKQHGIGFDFIPALRNKRQKDLSELEPD